MTLEQLRIFVAVAEREHVTRAARDLHLTQSATSAAVAALEARHAAKLFNRIGRRIELTPTGRLFLNEARAVLARAAVAETVLADLGGLKRGSLALAASQTVGNYWLPPLMHRFRATYPGISLNLTIGNTETVAAMVRDGVADFGFVEAAVEEAALSLTPVAQDELVLVTSSVLAPAKRRSLRPVDLKALRWVSREKGSGTRAIFEAAMAGLGIALAEIDIVLELPSNEAVRAAVLDGAGAALLSQLVVAVPLKAGSLVALNFAVPQRQFFLLRHKERYESEAAREFHRLIGTRQPDKHRLRGRRR
ncbi:MAG: LysR family transcriptional regulator [Alphaproteobacteria bacterium]|nr:LysR family transcriptional regulator [Alphaproteobacteria bacterium]MDE1987091.1 LysR family transcriptional regulator [Alphaproteobacteria bacterium]MDE2163924.1 LysR family transcriptional regulator [Alphaproteobacteria bacterium]MDE2500726.1 LysR family transcriptional regulator [Alphaproteobacteria bacterium]